MARTLIIGYGNPLRGDDGIGWAAAELLSESLGDSQTRVFARHQLTLDLAAEAAQVDRLILIDSTRTGNAGDIKVQRLEPGPVASPSSFSHHLTPAALVAVASSLYSSTPETFLVSVGGKSFDHSSELSPCLVAALPRLFSCVQQIMTSAR
jgi:hydrogenase maturation protease